MFDFVFDKPISSTTIINYLALAAFIAETIGIVVLKTMGMNSFPEWKYIDFFLRKNIYATISLRIILFFLSLVIFLPEMFSTYRLLSVIYFIYLFIFCTTCGWLYAHFKGYTKKTE